MKFGVVAFPGTTGLGDCCHAVSLLPGATAQTIWHKERSLKSCDCVIVPGGFSNSDTLQAGTADCFAPVMEEVVAFAERGGPVLGMGNGFQVLMAAGLLPGALIRNRSHRFVSKEIFCRVENRNSLFTCRFDRPVVRMVVAHGEGQYSAHPEVLSRLEDEGRVAFRYSDKDGRIIDEASPDGSVNNIAGVLNKNGNVLGLMPHPERCMEVLLGSASGRSLFESILFQCMGC